MKLARSFGIAIALTLASSLFFASQTAPCTFAVGYFHQITALRGRVVGTTWHNVPRWLRQSLARKQAKLVLYEYRSPRARWDDTSTIKTVETDDHGSFDFGSLRAGHYTLMVDRWNLFDVQILENMPRATDSVVIDISPVSPNCTGGHEFIVKFR